MIVTIFDRTIATRLRELHPQAVVTSPAEIAAPSLVGPCLGPDVIAAWHESGATFRVLSGDPPTIVSALAPRRLLPRRFWPGLAISLRSHDGHTKLLLFGLAGLAAVLLADWCWISLAHHAAPAEALLEAARVVATVGPATTDNSTSYALFSSVAMLSTVVFTAVFTAGLIHRLLQPRLLGLFGSRRAPRAGHVFVVGMGQVGIRLCTTLRELGIKAVGIDRNPAAPHLRIARSLKIPLVDGHGGDRRLLEDLGLRRARALAAVASDELDNIAVAIAASAICDHKAIVLRAGEQEAITETKSLLPLGASRDVLQLAATFVVVALQSCGRVPG